MSASQDRRSFISVLATLAGAAALDQSATVSAQAPAGSKWDMTWLDELRGKHRQLFDYGSLDLSVDTTPLRYVQNYLDMHKQVSGLETPEVRTLVGAMFTAFPMNASDALWAKYKLGERWKIVDPKTKEPAVRNIYFEDSIGPLGGGLAGIKKLQARGTTFWQCNVALGRVAIMLSQ